MNRLNNLYDQITSKTSAEELSQKVMNTEIRMTAKKRPSKAVAALLAATVGISALTVTAGAANGWDYAGIFNSIFGDKSENLMENIVPEATVLQDTIDIMDFELVAAAADNHGVLAILDVYPENGYKLIEKDENGNDIVKPFGDLFIHIDSESIFGQGVGVHIIEKSEEKIRLGVRMNTEDEIKGKKCVLTARRMNKKDENGEYEFDIKADYSWRAEFVADYSAEEIRYEKDIDLTFENKLGGVNNLFAHISSIEVSSISVWFEGENVDNIMALQKGYDSAYVLLENGEKVAITQITSSGHIENEGSTVLILGYETPVNPEEVTALCIGDKTIEIK